MTTPLPNTDWPKTLEWVYGIGVESLKARYATADVISKDAQTTLTVLLAGVGGTAAYAVKVFDGAVTPLTVGAGAAMIYLALLSIYLITKCMAFESYPALYQDPINLLRPDVSLDWIREQEIKLINARINDARDINSRKSARLNQIRLLAVLSPLVFVIAATFAGYVKPPSSGGAAGKVVLICTPTKPGEPMHCEAAI